MAQHNHFTELGERPVGALLLQYSLPAIIAMVASSLYNIVDAIFIGQSVGKFAIAGLALTHPLMALTAAFGAMVGVGGSTLMSIRLGQKDYEAARRILGNVVILNVVMGLTLGVVLLSTLTPILRLFGASDNTLPYAHDYMRILLCGNVVTHLYYGLNAQLRSTNRPKLAMYSTFGSVLINAVLAWLFVMVLGWGIKGAAWSTLIAQTSMLLWQIYLFTRPGDMIRFRRDIFRPDRRIMREAIVIGLPQFLVNSSASLISSLLMFSMQRYGGDTAVGAYGICNRLAMFIAFAVIGVNQGMLPIAGYNYGARKFDRLVSVVKYTLVVATVITTLGFAASHLFPVPLVSLFAKDASLIAASAQGLKIISLFWPVVGMQIVSTAFFQSIGMPGKSILLSLTRQLLFLVPGILLLPHLAEGWLSPSDGVWLSIPIADGAAALLSGTMLVVQLRQLRRSAA